MNRAHAHIADAEFVEIGAIDFSNILDRGVDLLTQGRRGFVMTEAIIAGGYAKNSGQMRRFYADHKTVIDDYFGHVDINKVVPDMMETTTMVNAKKLATTSIVAFLAGATITGTILYLRKR